jgi:bifunctional non-homologous end joining protein LigD
MPKKAALLSPPAPGAIRGELPAAQAPQLCQLVTTPPKSDRWLSEIKFDGYRFIVSIDHGTIRLLTRKSLDWADRLPHVSKALARLPVTTAMLDGELVALRPDGVSSFPELQTLLSEGADHRLHFYAFDLLHLNGWDLRPCALVDRMLRYSEHFVTAADLYRQACAMGLEGIVCKSADALYRSGRASSWLKIKCSLRETFVVVGWTLPAGSRVGIGALHLGYYDLDGRLHYAGAVGTGFDDRELTRLRGILDVMPATGPPVGMLYAGDPLDRAVRWVRPEMVAEVRFAAWSGSGQVRHAVYVWMRDDRAAGDVVRAVADPEARRQEVRPPRKFSGMIVEAEPPRPRRRKYAVPPVAR